MNKTQEVFRHELASHGGGKGAATRPRFQIPTPASPHLSPSTPAGSARLSSPTATARAPASSPAPSTALGRARGLPRARREDTARPKGAHPPPPCAAGAAGRAVAAPALGRSGGARRDQAGQAGRLTAPRRLRPSLTLQSRSGSMTPAAAAPHLPPSAGGGAGARAGPAAGGAAGGGCGDRWGPLLPEPHRGRPRRCRPMSLV